MSEDIDQEIKVIETVLNALAQVDTITQQRIMQYLKSKLESEWYS